MKIEQRYCNVNNIHLISISGKIMRCKCKESNMNHWWTYISFKLKFPGFWFVCTDNYWSWQWRYLFLLELVILEYFFAYLVGLDLHAFLMYSIHCELIMSSILCISVNILYLISYNWSCAYVICIFFSEQASCALDSGVWRCWRLYSDRETED